MSRATRLPVLLLALPLLVAASGPDAPDHVVRAAWEVELGLATPADPSRPLPFEESREVLTAAPVEQLLGVLLERIGPTPAPGVARAALDRLAERREPVLLPALADLAGHLDAIQLQHAGTREWLLDHFTGVAAAGASRAQLREAREHLPQTLVSAIELAELAAGYSEPLRRWPTGTLTDRELEERIDGLSRLPYVHDQAVLRLDFLTHSLTSPSDRVRARAAEALGRMGATEAVAELIELTDAEAGAKTRRAAGAALADLTGMRSLHDRTAWTSWYERETAWLRQDLPGLADDLRRGDAGAHATAQRLLLQHPGSAHRIAPVLADAALEQDEPLALRSLRALEALAGPTARLELKRVAEDGHDEVRSAAEAAVGRRE